MVKESFLTFDGKLVDKNFKCNSFANETLKLMFTRSSVRDFLPKKVPEDILRSIIEAGLHSPSAGNLQPYSIIRVEDEERKRLLAELCLQKFISSAPVLLVFCIDFHRLERWSKLCNTPFTAHKSFRHFWVAFIDVSICAQSICVAAESVGLGSVYIGTIIESADKVKDILALPEKVFPVILLCLGYPRSRPLPQKKLGYNIIVSSEVYHEPSDEELLKAFSEKYDRINVKVTEERLKVAEEVCRNLFGEDEAKSIVEKIRSSGKFNPAQYYFLLHYRADIMCKGNDVFVKMLEKAGLNFLKE
ncbi:MAG: nitroreductase family protein [Nitrososphaeria archaeon]|nr:nitroreductase family protein [Nitrososphaeria archaeon]